ncbi:hypothetical protein HYC85_009332 [Camellia sinensis]|uniref:Uncharacterized protein n=1 Tax=Camellia sinensis TaxID=4442 RepID=A0A7J7HHB8_CAMSI|nr:hypothetical protein HYC85_009332 [Camellia sinensis]
MEETFYVFPFLNNFVWPGASLVVNSSWKNPSGGWHVGCKLVYELFTDTLTSRLKKERKKKWDEKHQEAIAEAVKCLDEFDKVASFYFIGHKAMKGPVIDAVVWHDGELWRFDEDKGKGCSTACTKSVFERLEEEVFDEN